MEHLKKKGKEMAHLKKLPWELIEEILSRVPPKSLIRFRTVSKQWNALFDDKTFITNHKMTFRFILATESFDSDRKSKQTGDSGTSVVSVEKAVSLNGTLYWVCFCDKTDPMCYRIYKFGFSSGIWESFCNLPCGRNHDGDALVLGVFRGDRFSLLKQCMVTKKIEIWVTENKINENGADVVWMNFMTFLSPNLPDLVETVNYSEPSYFIEGKRLVVCSCDNTGHAWIYILGDNKLISKTRIDCVVDTLPLHCTFVPSLVAVPVPC
ncbi:F-box associated interaction domain [Arabidopsis suecica]|uniref:F-box associated interaction domain n=1 Tax=Arabidopsis suecica TaxID=45249 RepID=A0A8T2BEB8_ARASU|nr:F-box associated interaction domain [Arabidopsis suecica]